MCQAQDKGGIRCISDMTSALDKAKASGVEKRIIFHQARLDEAIRLSKDDIQKLHDKGQELIDSGEITKGIALVAESKTRLSEREAKMAENIASVNSPLAKRERELALAEKELNKLPMTKDEFDAGFRNRRDMNEKELAPYREYQEARQNVLRAKRELDTVQEFNSDGIHSETGSTYNTNGYDIHGFNEEGFNSRNINADGWSKDDVSDSSYYIRNQMHSDDPYLPINAVTGTKYDAQGFNAYGFDEDRYDKEGFSRYGDSNTGKIDREGYNENGWKVNTKGSGLSFNRKGIHPKTGTAFAPSGFSVKGYDKDGFNRDGYNAKGFNLAGRDNTGFDKNGINRSGFNRDGFNVETNSPYSTRGLTAHGFNKEGFNSGGRDVFGYSAKDDNQVATKFSTAFAGNNHHIDPKKLSRRDSLLSSPATRDLAAEGWHREAAQGFNPETGETSIRKAFIHKATGTTYNPEGFNILGLNKDGVNERGFDTKTGLHNETKTEFGTDGWNMNRSTLSSSHLG